MADAQFDAQGDEPLRCSSCGTPIPPEDVAEGRTRAVNGKVICFSCAEALARQEAVECKECGHVEPPLFDGKNYLCRHCGAVVKQGRRVEAAEKAARRADAECPYCKAPVPAGARLCPSCGARLIGSMRPGGSPRGPYLVGAGISAGIFALAMVLTAILTRPADRPSSQQGGAVAPAGVSEERLAALEKRLNDTIEANVTSLRADINRFKADVIRDVGAAVNIETKPLRDRLATLEREMAAGRRDIVTKPPEDVTSSTEPAAGQPAAPPPADEGPQDSLAAILEKARQEGEAKPDKTEPAGVAVEVAPVTITITSDEIRLDDRPVALGELANTLAARPGAADPQDQPVTLRARPDVDFRRVVEVIDTLKKAGYTSMTVAAIEEGATKTEADQGIEFVRVTKPRPADDAEAIAKLKQDVQKLIDDKKFAEALSLLDSRPDLRDPVWQGEREKTKQSIRRQVQQLFDADLALAENHAREGRYKEARAVYEKISEYGLPEMVREAQQRLKALKPQQEETATPPARVTVTEEDPRIRQFIEQLTDKEAAQHVRTRAARELGDLQAKQAVPALIAALEDRDWYLRVCAATSLKQIGDIRAVPALIKNLDHPMIPTRETALRALVAITGKDFGRDRAKWQEWWATTGSKETPAAVRAEPERPAPPEPVELPPKTTTFESQIVILDQENNSITINVPPGAGLQEGQQITILRGDDVLMTARVELVGFGTARAGILKCTEGVEVKAGDLITVRK